MNKFKHLIITAFIGGFFMSQTQAETDRPPPPDVTEQHVNFSIHCVKTFSRMMTVLEEYYGEKPIVLSEQSNEIVLSFFVNSTLTSSSLVVTRHVAGTVNDIESCIVWKGKSPDGRSFMIPPEVNFPTTFNGIGKGTNT